MGASNSKSPSKEVSQKERKVSSDSVKEDQESSGAGDNVAKPSPAKEESKSSPVKPDLTVTDEEVASVEAASKKMRDTVGGTSLEIVLSPAIKKVINLLKSFFWLLSTA